MVFEFSNYRSYLNAVLAERIAKNRGYSLRAMARSIDVSPSLLCDIQRGKKNLSLEKAYSVADALKLAGTEKDYFCGLVQLSTAKKTEAKASIETKLRSLNPRKKSVDLSIDLFTLIAEWYHLPILSMVDLNRSTFTPDIIASRLGISRAEASAAIDRLVRVELLTLENGVYKRNYVDGMFRSKVAHEGLRHFHRRMLEKAVESLGAQSAAEKFVATDTMAVDVSKLPEAFEHLRRMSRGLSEVTKRGEDFSEVYHLGIQFFRVTEKRTKKDFQSKEGRK